MSISNLSNSISIVVTLLGSVALTATTNAATISNLVHRWSFGDLTDSVGGADISLHGAALLNGSGSLSLPGSSTPRTNYASVAIGSTISAANSLTVETWATTTVNQTWSKVWMFGNSTGPHRGMDFAPVRRGVTNTLPGVAYSADFSQSETVIQEPNFASAPLATGTQFFSAVVFDANFHLISLYINGVYGGGIYWGGSVSDLGNTAENFFGAAVGFPDNDYNGSINELRIWNSALSSSEIASNAAAGPNVISVPEPSALLIGLVSTLGFARRRRANFRESLQQKTCPLVIIP